MKNNQLKIIALSVWWGAFTFYSGIVVSVGMQVLGSHTEMGFITQQVTIYINIFSLIIFLFNAYVIKNQKISENILVEEIIAVCLIGFQLLLFLLHYYQSELLDYQNHTINNLGTFHLLHRLYLIIETLIWTMISFLIGKSFFQKYQ